MVFFVQDFFVSSCVRLYLIFLLQQSFRNGGHRTAGGDRIGARALRIHTSSRPVLTPSICTFFLLFCGKYGVNSFAVFTYFLYLIVVLYYIRKHHQFVGLNSNIHAHNTRRRMDIHIESHNTDLCNRSVINIGTKLYNKLPGYIKEIDSYKTSMKELKSLLLLHSFYSVEQFVAL